MKKQFYFFPLFFFFLLPLVAEVTERDLLEGREQTAAWLELIDNGKYQESWDEGSIIFKQTIPKKSWVTILEKIRKPLGRVKSRHLLEQRPAYDPKGLPRGDYMVIFYQTIFDGDQEKHELVTLMRSNGRWRTLTYQIQ